MAIKIRLKIGQSGLQLLELRLLKADIGGYFQSVRFRNSCLQNIHKLTKKSNMKESF